MFTKDVRYMLFVIFGKIMALDFILCVWVCVCHVKYLFWLQNFVKFGCFRY